MGLFGYIAIKEGIFFISWTLFINWTIQVTLQLEIYPRMYIYRTFNDYS